MTLEPRLLKWRVGLLGAIAAISAVGLWSVDPIPQDQNYHDFAGELTLFGIANFWNVTSNLPFLFVGLIGLFFCLQNDELQARLSWGVLFAGVTMVAFGSSWYHLAPDNSTLVWDRLPMAIGFMGLFTALLYDYVDKRAEKFLLFPLLFLGVGSVIWWAVSDDLRFYVWVQFFPLVCILILLAIFRSPYRQNAYIVGALALYVLAKVLELGDGFLFEGSGEIFAGHPVKHLASAGAIYVLYLMLKHRKSAKEI